MKNIHGRQLIGFKTAGDGSDYFLPVNRITGESLPNKIYKATSEEVHEAVNLAVVAFDITRKKSGLEKSAFLQAIIQEIEAISPDLIHYAAIETALPLARLEGEKNRTLAQLRLFSSILLGGSWVNAKIETGDLDRKPLPQPDLRSMERPLGPVAVFGASNFPLAFSVAGGDTVSALAAGCSVIFKAHPAHPITCELVGMAIIRAGQICGMPEGIFSMLHGEGPVVGTELVNHAGIKAVAFTGSFHAGKAIYDAAVRRPNPIPVYAEMGSTNPVFVLPAAKRTKYREIAAGYANSVTLGVGQFCTNPGLLFYESDKNDKQFQEALTDSFLKTTGGTMLAENIEKSYDNGIRKREEMKGLEIVAKGRRNEEQFSREPVLFKTTSSFFSQFPELEEELFGPSSLIVTVESREELLSMAKNLNGHLTATVLAEDNELEDFRDLLNILEQKVGRVIINGFPTGVEVSHAMVHGGPFPATTDSRSTSVGTGAIYRFTRPVSYQSFPGSVLPEELSDNNSLGIWRTVNGQFTNDTNI